MDSLPSDVGYEQPPPEGAAGKPEAQEVDLSDVLHGLHEEEAAVEPSESATPSEQVQKDMGDDAARVESPEAAEQHF
jgi:hypothetical protein